MNGEQIATNIEQKCAAYGVVLQLKYIQRAAPRRTVCACPLATLKFYPP